MKRRNALVCMPVLALTALFSISCDLSPSDPVTVTLYSEPSIDGRVTWESDDGDGQPVYSSDAAVAIADIGDKDNDIGYTRAFVSFDFSAIPVGAQVSQAVLRVFQTSNVSGESYGTPLGLGDVIVDNVSYSVLDTLNQTTLDELFNASTTGSDIGIGPLATSYSADSWHELDVLNSAKDELAHYHNGRVQFRIYHSGGTNDDSNADTDGWAMSEHATHRPELVVTYTE